MKNIIALLLICFSISNLNAQCVTPISEGCGNGGYTWEYNLDPGSTINLTTLSPAGFWFVSYDLGVTWQTISAPGVINTSGTVWILGVDPDPADFLTFASCGWDFSDCTQAGATFNVSGGHDCLIDGCTPCGISPPTCTPPTINTDLIGDVTCLGGSDGFINTTVSGSSTYTITWDNGVSSNSDDITALTSGSYTITATDDTDPTCFATSTIVVVAGGQPIIAANTNVNNVCSGDLVTLFGAGGVSYSWDNGVTDNTPTSVVSTTTYTVTGTDIDGCSNTDQITINVVPCSAPVADFSAVDSTLCISDCIDFTDLSISSASGITSWLWDFGNGSTSSDQNPTNICYLTAGNFTVTLTVTDANGVDTETKVNFIAVVNCSGPIIQFSATDSAICEGDCISFTDLSTSNAGGLTNWAWDFGNGQSSTDQNPIGICFGNAGTFTIQLTGTDANGNTSSSITNMIAVSSCNSLSSSFSYEILPVCNGIELKLQNTSVGATNYNWDIGGVIMSTSDHTSVILDYNQLINVSFTVSNSTSSDVVIQSIEILTFNDYQNFEIPNVFTPNGDGNNDRFKIPVLGKIEACASLKIFNRWGQLMFESSANSFSWDGTTSVGVEVPNGAYFYTFEISGEAYTGLIKLMR